MDRRDLVYAPRAQRNLLRIEKRQALRILADLALMQTPPWPPGKVKRQQVGDFWEVRTGDFRSIFWPHGKKVAIFRIVNRRDLAKAVGRLDLSALKDFLERRDRRG